MTPLEQIRQLVNTTLVRSHINVVEDWLRQRPGSMVIDIGANTGGFVQAWLDNGASVVHAFEPVPQWFSRLDHRFQHDSRVFANRVAISDKISTVTGAQILGCHTLADPAKVKMDVALEDTGAFDFDTTTVDVYVKNNAITKLDLIKLDVDGYEPQAVRGMRHTLSYLRPLLMIELSFLPIRLGESVERMIMQLYDQDYKLCTMDREVCDDPLIVLEAFPWRTSFDMVAVPVEHITLGWPRIR